MCKIKFCGLRTVDDYLHAWKLGVDYAGFVCYEHSPRHIDARDVAELLRVARARVQAGLEDVRYPEPKTVGLFVNWDIERVAQAINMAKFDIAQLYDESIEEKISIPYWRVYRIGNTQDFSRRYDVESIEDIMKIEGEEMSTQARLIDQKETEEMKNLGELNNKKKNGASAILLDSLHRKSAGGIGISFDWNILRKAEFDTPYFIAGGINIENIKDLLLHKPYGIDMSSGIEKQKGIKDHGLMTKIIEIVREA